MNDTSRGNRRVDGVIGDGDGGDGRDGISDEEFLIRRGSQGGGSDGNGLVVGQRERSSTIDTHF